ncbi:MAG: glycerol-3-phosphate 1-O-acyltransferase PlsY [Eggerthellaceae bacterium]|nr:glycerol-3-phosphate 1-O-acyltransferase PlsY [Eggerthellaceae bacterium]
MEFFLLAVVGIVTFGLGSIPWGVLISRWFFHTDIRNHGSGNVGTTNAFRAMGKKGGVIVFLLDFGKGILSGIFAVAIAKAFLPSASVVSYNTVLAVSALCASLGHIFSPWLGFRGGKGIAVAIGVLYITFGWLGASIELFVIFAILVAVTRYVAVGSMVAALACGPISAWLFWGDWWAIIVYTCTGLVVFWAHRENLQRLLQGNERRIGKQDSADSHKE